MKKQKKKKKIRNPAVLPARQRKAGPHKPRSQKRQNGKNQQQELLKEIDQ